MYDGHLGCCGNDLLSVFLSFIYFLSGSGISMIWFRSIPAPCASREVVWILGGFNTLWVGRLVSLVTENGLDAHYYDDGRFDDGILDMMIT
jgi:hypothetical protein